MILVVISSEETIAALEANKAGLRALGRSARHHSRAGGRADLHHQAGLLVRRRDPLPRDGVARDVHGAGVPVGGGRERSHPRDPRQPGLHDHACGRAGRAGQGGRPAHGQAQGSRRQPADAAALLGQVRRARQQPRQHRSVACALPRDHRHLHRIPPDRLPRPPRVGVAPLHLDRARPLQRVARPDRHQRVEPPCLQGSQGHDGVRSPRRLHLRLLRRLGRQLHDVGRAHAQLDRALLRDAGRWGRIDAHHPLERAAPVAPAEHAAARGCLGDPQQRQPATERGA